MPRWGPNAAQRLQDAAIDLFTRQGYDRTTVAEVAAAAGLTERTFFNHFAAKRDVLFGPTSEQHRETTARALAACPPSTPPLEAVVHGLQAAAATLEGLREPSARRRSIIDATPELREREQAKRAALAATIAEVLRTRGVDPETAQMTAGAGLLIEQVAEQRWAAPDATESLPDLLAAALASLRAAVSP